MYRTELLSVAFLLILTNYINSENQFITAVRSLNNKSNQTRGGNNEDSVLKREIRKHLKDCGSKTSDEDSSESDESSNRRNNRKHDGSGGTYPDFYGESRYSSNSGRREETNGNDRHYGNNENDNRNSRQQGSNNGREGVDGSDRQYGNNENNDRNFRRQGSHQNNDSNGKFGNNGNSGIGYNQDDNEENRKRGNSPSNTNYNRGYENQNGYYQLSNGNDRSNTRSYAAGQVDPYDVNRNMGYNTVGYGRFGANRRTPYGGTEYFGPGAPYRRTKREDEDCVTQCALGYLDVLDDNRVPSETALIKYLQDHLPNDRKRIQVLRETRRCFARLATTDNDDGCEFSKSLANCLKLEVE